MRKSAQFKQERHTARVERKAQKRAQQKHGKGSSKPSRRAYTPAPQQRNAVSRLVNNFGALAEKLVKK